jgi:hypothetical protein
LLLFAVPNRQLVVTLTFLIIIKIEFQFTNATQSANFRLLKEDYGPAEEWVLFQANAKLGPRDAPKKPGARGAPMKSLKSKLAKKNKK